MTTKLPVTVLLPTRNSMGMLPDHLETMQQWLDLVAEVVVVDSQSHDGTMEFLKSNLHHPNARFLDHPPGLYQSWNHGIFNARSEYLYISTVGDAITRDGLAHLTVVASRFKCDVVVSPPGFVDDAGHELAKDEWAPHWLIRILGLKKPIVLEGETLMAFALATLPNAILGSSASNLYRTDCLKQHPFPTDYGTVGDGAWGVANALQIRMGITPSQISWFREHTKAYHASEYAVNRLPEQLCALGKDRLESAFRSGAVSRSSKERQPLLTILQAAEERLCCQRKLEACRESPWPWILNPSAWQARSGRMRTQRIIEAQFRSIAQGAHSN